MERRTVHANYKAQVLELPSNPTSEEMAEFNRTMDLWQDAMVQDQKNIAKAFDISLSDAGLIQYLRTRSRWTQEKEDELIRLAKAGEELPNVLAGEF